MIKEYENNNPKDINEFNNALENKRNKKENLILIPKENSNFNFPNESLAPTVMKITSIEISDKSKGKINDIVSSVGYDKLQKIQEEIASFEADFKEKWKDSFRAKIKSFPLMKKNKNLFPKIKFHKKDIILDKVSYPHELFFINFEKLIVDIVLSFKKSKEKLLNFETKNIGSYILFYLCNITFM